MLNRGLYFTSRHELLRVHIVFWEPFLIELFFVRIIFLTRLSALQLCLQAFTHKAIDAEHLYSRP